MKIFKRIFWLLVIVLIVIQFFHPAKNQSPEILSTDITKTVAMPDDVHSILGKACYDCHSNNTIYPWYFNIQPVAWWMGDHIDEGKHNLNFSEFGSDPIRWQYKKMESAIKEVKEGEMPLDSYTWIHKNAILADGEKQKLKDWFQSVRDTLKARYPADSLLLHKDEIRGGDEE